MLGEVCEGEFVEDRGFFLFAVMMFPVVTIWIIPIPGVESTPYTEVE